MSVSDKDTGLLHSDSMNQAFLGSLETMVIIYSINKLGPLLYFKVPTFQGTDNIVREIMKTYTYIALIQDQVEE